MHFCKFITLEEKDDHFWLRCSRDFKENIEKELSRRIKEMNSLEDTLRRECSNEIERNNAQNEERLQHIKELYQKVSSFGSRSKVNNRLNKQIRGFSL